MKDTPLDLLDVKKFSTICRNTINLHDLLGSISEESPYYSLLEIAIERRLKCITLKSSSIASLMNMISVGYVYEHPMFIDYFAMENKLSSSRYLYKLGYPLSCRYNIVIETLFNI